MNIGGVLLIGYEMYRLLSLSIPSLGGNKMAVKKRKTKTQQPNNQNDSFVDLDENEREMEKLIGEREKREGGSVWCWEGVDVNKCVDDVGRGAVGGEGESVNG